MAHVSECDATALADFGASGDARTRDGAHDEAPRTVRASEARDPEGDGRRGESWSLVSCPPRD